MTVPKVLLIVMPFFSTVAPAAGPSILKPRLAAEGIACDIVYLNIDFAAMIGHSLFERICESKSDGGETLIGERIFAEEFFPGQLPDDHDYRRYLQKVYAEAASYFEGFLVAKRYVRPFLDTCLSTIPWEKYDAFGFSTMFEQNLASLTLARRLKERFPDKAVIFGGSNCDGEMGIELHRCFPFIDFVCCGEADATLPELVKRLSAGLAMDDLPGVVRRTGSESVLAAPPQLWEELDALPYPDYDDYFARLHHASLPFPERGLIMETSRGCWWGARSQCRFCGLNPNSISFRAKGPKRVVAELDHLIDRYCRPHGVQSLTMVDNILPMVFFRSLFPELAEHRLPVRIFYEVKANLSPEQLRLLADAGIAWVQPGIESLSSHVLRLMAKGVTALQNVQFLKSCLRHGVQPVWNFINGIPGEREEDYQEMLSLIEKIHHLPPPKRPLPL